MARILTRDGSYKTIRKCDVACPLSGKLTGYLVDEWRRGGAGGEGPLARYYELRLAKGADSGPGWQETAEVVAARYVGECRCRGIIGGWRAIWERGQGGWYIAAISTFGETIEIPNADPAPFQTYRDLSDQPELELAA